jgi:galactoside 2-L-fucosyltransferase 1/2
MFVADEDFHIEAMKYFCKKLGGNVAFLIVSDDPGWCLRNLLKTQNDVFVVGKGEDTTPGQDLDIMEACNHSIIDYGTFGVCGANLASGETILYNITNHYSIHVPELLPNWRVMN